MPHPAMPSISAEHPLAHAIRWRDDSPPPVPVEPEDLPAVVDGQVTRTIEIRPYPNHLTAAAGCTNFAGQYVTDRAEIAAIRRRVEARAAGRGAWRRTLRRLRRGGAR